MNAHIEELSARVTAALGELAQPYPSLPDELAIDIEPANLLEVATRLRDTPELRFEMLIDLAGVDYLDYGRTEWRTSMATATGFSRGVNGAAPHTLHDPKRRFAVVSQLLSIAHNQRLRLRVWCEDLEDPVVDSLTGVWASADWFEREAFDLYGILFRGHPDLRRLLTDYGFIGHPFRKDFPLIGNVEVRYDPAQQRVIYEPVSIEPRTLVPRVIRRDNRYELALQDVKRDARAPETAASAPPRAPTAAPAGGVAVPAPSPSDAAASKHAPWPPGAK